MLPCIPPGNQPMLCGGDFCPLVAAGFPEIAEAAFLQGAILQLQYDLRRPAVPGEGNAFHDTHGAGNFVDHDFAEKAFARGGNFCFAHAASVAGKSGAFNVRMQAGLERELSQVAALSPDRRARGYSGRVSGWPPAAD